MRELRGSGVIGPHCRLGLMVSALARGAEGGRRRARCWVESCGAKEHAVDLRRDMRYGSGVFMSVWISACDSARLYT
jgi:hypothetical protein